MPRSFRGYLVGDIIATGGMSIVHAGTQIALDRKVAIKVLHPLFGSDATFIARFEREAKAASSLGHRNIISVIDYGTEDGVYYIVTEFIDGPDLRVLLEKHAPLPLEIVLLLVEEIARGLAAAHQKSIVHRDIKPGNILLSKNGDVKIGDFGLARRGSEDVLTAITIDGSVLGTPSYMSPEQAAGESFNHRTDIFSLGVVIYEMISGERPFAAPSSTKVREKLISLPHPPLRERCPGLPEPVERMVDRMLQKEPEKRFQNMDEVLRALEQCMEAVDPSGSIFRRRLELLAKFSADPDSFDAELRAARIKLHMSRGQHYMTLGLDRIQDATAEFQTVLLLDPGNRKAAESLAELERSRETSPGTANGQSCSETPLEPPAPFIEAPRTRSSSRRRPLIAVGGAVALVCVALIGIRWGKDPHRTGPAPSASLVSAQSAPEPTGNLRVSTAPDGAFLRVDGRDKGVIPAGGLLLAEVPVGRHVVEMSREGFAACLDTVAVAEGRTTEVSRTLVRSQSALRVTSVPAARIWTSPADPTPRWKRGGTTPAELTLSAGRVLLRLEIPEYAKWETTLTVKDGPRCSVAHQFPQPGHLTVNVKQGWGSVFVDGTPIGRTPIIRRALSPGEHRVEVRREGLQPYSETVLLKENAEYRIAAVLQ